MKTIFFVASILALASIGAQADTLFRWVDKEGKVHYGEKPAEDASAVVQKKFATPTVTNEDLLSYETRRARESFPVILYVGERCGEPCVQARDYLNKRGIPFSEKFLANDEEIAAFKSLSGMQALPSVAIGKSYLQGFSESQWGSELDIAGYSREAPYGYQPLAPVSAQPASAVVPASAATAQ
jgi:hypothetical protein